VPDGTYTLQLDAPPAGVRDLGPVTVANGRAEWKGEVRLTPGHDAQVQMVDSAGTVVCHATVPGATVTAS
jgi:hypothetical protein